MLMMNSYNFAYDVSAVKKIIPQSNKKFHHEYTQLIFSICYAAENLHSTSCIFHATRDKSEKSIHRKIHGTLFGNFILSKHILYLTIRFYCIASNRSKIENILFRKTFYFVRVTDAVAVEFS